MKTTGKHIRLFIVMVCCLGGMPATVTAQNAAISGDAILGKWTNNEQTRVIEFVKNGTSYDAIIREAPDKNMIGKKQVVGLRFDGKNYKKGKVLLPKQEREYPCSVKLKNNNTIELTAKAGLMTRSQTWTRVL